MAGAETEVLDREPGVEGADEVEEQEQQVEQTNGTEAAGDDNTEGADDQVVITLGEEPAEDEEEQAPAPQWVKDLRKDHRELQRKYRDLEKKAATATTETVVELGAKPTLEGCDYDADRFEADLEAWHARKRDVEHKAAKKREAAESAQAEFQATVASYEKAKTGLRVNDFETAEEAFKLQFTPTQQGLLLDAASSPESAAQLVYALGMNSKEAKTLASLIDKPVKFVAAVVRLESKLKVTPRKTAPLPERTVRGNAPITGTDTQLERLRNEADRTGDRTKVAAYMKQQRLKQRA